MRCKALVRIHGLNVRILRATVQEPMIAGFIVAGWEHGEINLSIKLFRDMKLRKMKRYA
jgi:hypothetical protein